MSQIPTEDNYVPVGASVLLCDSICVSMSVGVTIGFGSSVLRLLEQGVVCVLRWGLGRVVRPTGDLGLTILVKHDLDVPRLVSGGCWCIGRHYGGKSIGGADSGGSELQVGWHGRSKCHGHQEKYHTKHV